MVPAAFRLHWGNGMGLRVMLAAALVVAGSAELNAQRTAAHAWHHDSEVPEYLALVQGGGAAVRMPPLPSTSGRVSSIHHTHEPPVYAVGGPGLRAIAVPPPPPGRAPVAVRGLYVNGWAFSSSRFFDLVDLADTTEINSFVVDVKDMDGYISYRSNVPTAISVGANAYAGSRDPRERLQLLHAKGIHPIARIVVARDPVLARGKRDWAVTDTRGGLWIDGLGEPWVDAYHDSVWIYASQLAAEAVLLGFREVQFDYVRFPDEKHQRMQYAVFAARPEGESKRSAVRRQVAALGERVRPLGVPFTLDIFGLTTSATGDLGIGQYWEDLAPLADVLLPMVYPSHYGRGMYGLAFPNGQPYDIVRLALQDAVRRSQLIPNAARIRPYLQAFSIRGMVYRAEEVRAQIQAAEDLGITEWIMWNARGVYPAGSFRSKPPQSRAAPGSARP